MRNKRILFISILVLIFIYTGLFGINTPWLHVSGNQIQDPEGNEVILRGLNFVSIWVSSERIGPRYSFYPHEEEPDEGKANLKALIDLATDHSKGWYTTVIRMPVYPWQVDVDPGWMNCTSEQLARYKELLDCAVQYATSKGIYVIIDWHYVHHYGDKLDECLEFWDYAADRYKDMSNVMFELYNEPIAFEETSVPNEPNYDWTLWKDTIAQPLVDRIRNHHEASNIVIVGGPRWSQLLGGAYDYPVQGENIVYACHIYPYHFENQGGGAEPGDLSPYVGKTIEKYPIFFTEWGFQDGGAIPCDALDEDFYAAGMKQYLIDHRTSWCAWVFDPWWEPIMFDNWDYQGLLGNSLPNTGGYMGQMVNDFLTEFRNSNLPGGNIPPTVSVTDPAEGASFEEGSNITISADASDEDDTISLVEFFAGASKIGEDTTFPYSITWNNVVIGNYAITAIATDNESASTTSEAVNISVSNGTNVYEDITAPFTKDGVGEFYWKITDIPGYISSWNLELLEINGVDLTNVWKSSDDLPAKQGGYYYIHYNGLYDWSHFEVK